MGIAMMAGAGMQAAAALEIIVFAYSEVSFHTHFDGVDAATTAVDESDQAHVFSFFDNAQVDTAQSKFGGASMLFDGAGDYLTLPNHSSLHLGSNDFTIEFFVRFNGDPGTSNRQFMGLANTTGTQESYTVAFTNNKLRFNYSTNGSGGNFKDQAWNPAGNTWYHIAIVRVENFLKHFVDGTQLGSDAAFDFTLHNSTAEFFIATVHAGGAPTQFLDGWLEEIRIVNGTAIYLDNFDPPTKEYDFHRVTLLGGFDGADGDTTFTSEDRYLHTITFTGNAQIDTAQSKFGGSSLLLDGTDDYVSVPSHASLDLGTGDFTIEFQMRINSLATHNIISWSTSTQGAVYMNSGSGILRFQAGGSDRITSGNLVVNVWYHIALVRVGGVHELFVDGVSLGTNSDSITYLQSSFEIGRRVGSGAEFNGWIDEVRVIKGTAIYLNNFTPPITAFPRS